MTGVLGLLGNRVLLYKNVLLAVYATTDLVLNHKGISIPYDTIR